MTPPPPIGTVYVELPYGGPTRADALSMLAAVRLAAARSERRYTVRRLDDVRGDLPRCRANAERVRADGEAIAVIGTYDSACTAIVRDALASSSVAVVSPVNAAHDLGGIVRIAPTTDDEPSAVVAAAQALGAQRLVIAEGTPGAGGPVQELLARATPSAIIVPVARALAVAQPGDLIAAVGLTPAQTAELVAARRPITVRLLLASANAVPATLAFPGAERVLVLSRFVPASSLDGRAGSFADAFAQLDGEPRGFDLYAADAMIAIATAVDQQNGARAGLRETLGSLQNVPGVTRTFSVLPDGRTTPQRMAVLGIEKGGFRVDRVLTYDVV